MAVVVFVSFWFLGEKTPGLRVDCLMTKSSNGYLVAGLGFWYEVLFLLILLLIDPLGPL